MGYPNGKPDCETFRETLPKIIKIIGGLLALVLGGGMALALRTPVNTFFSITDSADSVGIAFGSLWGVSIGAYT